MMATRKIEGDSWELVEAMGLGRARAFVFSRKSEERRDIPDG